MVRKRSLRLKILYLLVFFILLTGAVIHFALQRQASATTNVSVYPSWMDPEVVDHALNYWTRAQKERLNQVVSASGKGCGLTSLVTPNATEISLLGAGAKSFLGSTAYINDTTLSDGYYHDQFRIALAAYPITLTAGGWGQARYKVSIGNPMDHPVYLSQSSIRISISGVDPNNPNLVDNYVGDAILLVNNGQPLTLAPGQYISLDSGSFQIGADWAAYATVYFNTRIYTVGSSGVMTWGGDGSSVVNCFPDPFSFHKLGGGAISFSGSLLGSITPTPTSSVTYSPTPTSTASVTNGTDVTLHRGFNAIGSSVPVDPEYLASNGLYLYEFDGVGNKWLQYPIDDIQTRAFRGYYIYAREQKTIRLGYNMVLPVSFPLTSGWNMVWTPQSKTLDNLLLSINGTVDTAQHWSDRGKILPNVFSLKDDSASLACNYFAILSRTYAGANCAAQAPEYVTSLPSSKAFWVYVK